MQYRVVVCSCLDANILVTAQCTNRSLSRLEREVLSSLHPHRQEVAAPPHWTHLLIDEVSHLTFSAGFTTWWIPLQAAQGSEPELMIPISVVDYITKTEKSQPEISTSLYTPQLVLCGDPNQCERLPNPREGLFLIFVDALVGPIVASDAARAAELDVSLLERLFESPLYSTHPKSEDESTTDYQRFNANVPCTNLVKVCGTALF